MEKCFKSLTILEFESRYPDEESCYTQVIAWKWPDGYHCVKCGHTHYGKGKKRYDRKCTRCDHQESPTCGTLFHHLKFSLRSAFWMIYFLSTGNGLEGVESKAWPLPEGVLAFQA